MSRLQRRSRLKSGKPPARRTELRPGGRLRRFTPLRSRPSRRARPDEALTDWCQAAIEGVCTGRAEHRHHLLRRGQGGTDDIWNTKDLCCACHSHVHANTGWAKREGLLLQRCPGSGQTPDLIAAGPEAPCPGCGRDVALTHDLSGWGGAEFVTHGRRAVA